MNVILFGASGMVGQDALREYLLDSGVEKVLSIGGSTAGKQNGKLQEIVQKDIANLSAIEDNLRGYDAQDRACDAQPQTRHDIHLLVRRRHGQRGRIMWARVKGQTGNALLRLPLKAAYMFRPRFIQPLQGIRSKTAIYRIPYIPLLLNSPKYITTPELRGRAMIKAARQATPKRVLESKDINAL
jgi:hypothetical protein